MISTNIYSPPGYGSELKLSSALGYWVQAAKRDDKFKWKFIDGPYMDAKEEAIAEWNSIFGKGVA